MHAAGARLIDMVAAPHALIESQGRLRLNANYYITKQVQLALSFSQLCIGGAILHGASEVHATTACVLGYPHRFGVRLQACCIIV